MNDDYAPSLSWNEMMAKGWEASEAAERAEELAAVRNRAAAAKAKHGVTTDDPLRFRLIQSFADRWIAGRPAAALAEYGWIQAGRAPVEKLELSLSGPLELDNIEDGNPIEVLAALNANPSVETLVVHIESGGGLASLAVDVFLALRTHRAARRVTIASGRCKSAAVIVFLAGAERICRSNTTFLVHKTEGGNPVENRSFDEIGIICARAAGVDENTYRSLLAEGKEFDAQHALQLGIATKISDTDFVDHQTCVDDGEEEMVDITTVGGSIVAFPMKGRVVAQLARTFRAAPACGHSVVMGLPSPIVNAAWSRLGSRVP